MVDASILTTWGATYPGREAMGLSVFQGAISYFMDQKTKGNIAEFKVGITDVGNIAAQSGYMLVEGTAEQLRNLVDTEDYKRLLTKAAHVVPVSVSHAVTGNSVMRSVERLVSVRNELGIKQ